MTPFRAGAVSDMTKCQSTVLKELVDLLGRHAARVKAAYNGTHARPSNSHDWHPQFLERLEHADMSDPACASSAQDQSDPGPINVLGICSRTMKTQRNRAEESRRGVINSWSQAEDASAASNNRVRRAQWMVWSGRI
jgi:hypothetical protein